MPNQLHINKINTMYGKRYAITETSYTYDKKGNKIPYTHSVEYKSGEDELVAIFPLTEDGLSQAKELRKVLKNNEKKENK